MKFDPDDVHAWLSEWVTNLGASPYLQLRSGPEEASTSATATGTLIAEIPLPSSPFTSPASGVITKSGSWSVNSVAAGVIGHARFLDNTKTDCRWVGKVTQAIAYTLTASASAPASVLTVADTSGMTFGAGVAGNGIAAGTTVTGLTATTVSLSQPITTSLTTSDFIVVGDTSGDILISGAYIPSSGTTVTVAAFSMGWPSLI